jgi:hypothetical protein
MMKEYPGLQMQQVLNPLKTNVLFAVEGSAANFLCPPGYSQGQAIALIMHCIDNISDMETIPPFI